MLEGHFERVKYGILREKHTVLAWRSGEKASLEKVKMLQGFQYFTLQEYHKKLMYSGVYMRCVEGHLHFLMKDIPLATRLAKEISRGFINVHKRRIHEVFLSFCEIVPKNRARKGASSVSMVLGVAKLLIDLNRSLT